MGLCEDGLPSITYEACLKGYDILNPRDGDYLQTCLSEIDPADACNADLAAQCVDDTVGVVAIDGMTQAVRLSPPVLTSTGPAPRGGGRCALGTLRRDLRAPLGSVGRALAIGTGRGKLPPMSHPHPTISAWQRDEHEGDYVAELHDWKLTVSWTPNHGEKRGHFTWTAEREGAKTAHAHEPFEEMEAAMADAEIFARNDADARAAEASAGAEQAAAGH
ncbi:MAG TPA: hypothetical protein ENK57_19680 [Polyangiaceae bacterium]|nr:hypothetical protein [Polyangiaceae bacterium]